MPTHERRRAAPGKRVLLTVLVLALAVPLTCRAESVLDRIRNAEQKLEQLSHATAQPGAPAPAAAPQPGSPAGQAAAASASGTAPDTAGDSDGPCCTPADVEKVAKSVGYIDVVGIKLGMTPQQVVAAIHAHNPKLRVGIVKSRFDTPSGRIAGPTYAVVATDAVDTRSPHEIIGVQFTTAPSPQFADMIFRYVAFFPRPVMSTIINAMDKKYGTENFENGGDHYWVHGADHQLLTSVPQAANLCSPNPGTGQPLWAGGTAAGMIDWLNVRDSAETWFSGNGYVLLQANSFAIRPLNTPGQTDSTVQPACLPFTFVGGYVAGGGPSAEIDDFRVAAYSPAMAYDSYKVSYAWLENQVIAAQQKQEKAAKERAAPPM